ncbi:MAG TPA: hypothetical protein VGL81_21140 [Polyangiaceae bacterium]
MSTWAARYVRLGAGADRAKDVSRLQDRMDAEAELHDDGKSPFALWIVAAPMFQPDDMGALSKDFGEALSVSVQTVADLVIYDHYVAGERVRGLTYAGEAGWIRVVGQPEAWEAKTLFSALKLAELSEELEEDLEGELLAREKAELERLWKAGTLVEGSVRPPADPAALPKALEKHFALPARPAGSYPRSGTLPRA